MDPIEALRIRGAGSGGTMPVRSTVAQTITPGVSDITKQAGIYYGDITIQGDPDLVAANIKLGANIFGVAGSFSGKRQATGTFAVAGAGAQTVAGLAFTPSYIMVYKNTNQSPFDWEIYIGNNINNDISINDSPIYASAGGMASGSTINFSANKITFNANGFTVSILANGPSGFRWLAFE